MASNALAVTLPCGCTPTVSRCPEAAARWRTVLDRRAARSTRGTAEAEAAYAQHVREQWAWRDAQKATR